MTADCVKALRVEAKLCWGFNLCSTFYYPEKRTRGRDAYAVDTNVFGCECSRINYYIKLLVFYLSLRGFSRPVCLS